MGDVSNSNNSLLTNLVNKVSYKIQEAAYDPKADEFAQKKAEREAQEKAKAQEQKNTNQPQNNTQSTESKGNPNSFSGRRLASKVYNQFITVVKTYIWPFIALMVAMIVANEMIVYSVPVRIIFFIFTFYMVWRNALASLILPIFYIFKGGYSYYTNQMTDGPKQRIMPTIYSLLPITTYKPTSKLGTFVLYPFTYPKTELGAIELPEITKDYWKSLVESLKDYSTVKDLPDFAKDIKKAQEGLSRLHEAKGQFVNFSFGKGSENAQTGQAVNTAVPNAPAK
jgi:uncharacterized membrane protein